jgi:hypothetical protein
MKIIFAEFKTENSSEYKSKPSKILNLLLKKQTQGWSDKAST